MQHDPKLHRERVAEAAEHFHRHRRRQARQAAIGAGVAALIFYGGMRAAMELGSVGGAAVLAIAGSVSLMLGVIAASEA